MVFVSDYPCQFLRGLILNYLYATQGQRLARELQNLCIHTVLRLILDMR